MNDTLPSPLCASSPVLFSPLFSSSPLPASLSSPSYPFGSSPLPSPLPSPLLLPFPLPPLLSSNRPALRSPQTEHRNQSRLEELKKKLEQSDSTNRSLQ